MSKPQLKLFQVSEHAIKPTYGTANAACFDLSACIEGNDGKITAFDCDNDKYKKSLTLNDELEIDTLERVLVPTGWIFDIPEGYSMRIHPRSGLSLKSGLMLGNCEGVVDEDYINESFVMLFNTSNTTITIKQGERIAQAELVKDVRAELSVTETHPEQKTDRVGGFGSTGK